MRLRNGILSVVPLTLTLLGCGGSEENDETPAQRIVRFEVASLAAPSSTKPTRPPRADGMPGPTTGRSKAQPTLDQMAVDIGSGFIQDVAIDDQGRLAVLFYDTASPRGQFQYRLAVLDKNAVLIGSPILVASIPYDASVGFTRAFAVKLERWPSGEIAVVYDNLVNTMLALFTAEGKPLGQPRVVNNRTIGFHDTALLADGRLAILDYQLPFSTQGQYDFETFRQRRFIIQFFDKQGQPAGANITLDPTQAVQAVIQAQRRHFPDTTEQEVRDGLGYSRVTANAAGGWTVLWNVYAYNAFTQHSADGTTIAQSGIDLHGPESYGTFWGADLLAPSSGPLWLGSQTLQPVNVQDDGQSLNWTVSRGFFLHLSNRGEILKTQLFPASGNEPLRSQGLPFLNNVGCSTPSGCKTVATWQEVVQDVQGHFHDDGMITTYGYLTSWDLFGQAFDAAGQPARNPITGDTGPFRLVDPAEKKALSDFYSVGNEKGDAAFLWVESKTKMEQITYFEDVWNVPQPVDYRIKGLLVHDFTEP